MTPEELAIHRAHLDESLIAMTVAHLKVAQIVRLLTAYMTLHGVPGRVDVVDGAPILVIEEG